MTISEQRTLCLQWVEYAYSMLGQRSEEVKLPSFAEFRTTPSLNDTHWLRYQCFFTGWALLFAVLFSMHGPGARPLWPPHCPFSDCRFETLNIKRVSNVSWLLCRVPCCSVRPVAFFRPRLRSQMVTDLMWLMWKVFLCFSVRVVFLVWRIPTDSWRTKMRMLECAVSFAQLAKSSAICPPNHPLHDSQSIIHALSIHSPRLITSPLLILLTHSQSSYWASTRSTTPAMFHRTYPNQRLLNHSQNMHNDQSINLLIPLEASSRLVPGELEKLM